MCRKPRKQLLPGILSLIFLPHYLFLSDSFPLASGKYTWPRSTVAPKFLSSSFLTLTCRCVVSVTSCQQAACLNLLAPPGVEARIQPDHFLQGLEKNFVGVQPALVALFLLSKYSLCETGLLERPLGGVEGVLLTATDQATDHSAMDKQHGAMVRRTVRRFE